MIGPPFRAVKLAPGRCFRQHASRNGGAWGALWHSGAFVLSILPISVAYHAAHYLPSFLANVQYALNAFSDPFAQGWDLLGLGRRHVTVSFLADYHAVAVLWSVQAGVIVLGHVLAVLIAHAIAVERFGAGRAAMASQLPLALLMIGYTTFGLWLLAAPTAG